MSNVNSNDNNAVANVDKDKLVSLMVEYDQLTMKIEEYKEMIGKAASLRSAVVGAILQANGGKKRIRRNGREMLISHKGDSWFFRGAKAPSDITEL